MDSNRRIAVNSLYLSIRMVIVLCISLYTTRLTLRILGVEDYGVYNVVCGLVTMFAFLNTSMNNGIQRFYNYELGKNGIMGANAVYNASLIIQLLLTLILIALAESFGLWYLHHRIVIPEDRLFAAEWIFQLSIISSLFLIMEAPYAAAVMAHEKMDFFSIVSVLDVVLKLIAVCILPLLQSDLLILYGAMLTGISIFDFVLYFLFCKKHFKEIKLRKRREKSDKRLLLDMLGFSGWNVFGSFSNTMRDQGLNLIINLFYGPVVNAARGVAMQVNTGITGLVSSILTPVRPQVIQSYAKGDLSRSMRLTHSISKFSLCFLYLLALPVCVESSYILKLWLGDSVPAHTQSFVILILLTSAILIPMGALATLVHASGKMRKYQVIGSIVKILSIPAAFFLLKKGLKPEWALIMVLLFDAIGLIVGMFIIRTLMSFSIMDYFRSVFFPIIPMILISFAAVWCLHLVIQNDLLRFFSVLIVGSAAIAGLSYLTALSPEEKQLITALVKSRIQKDKR